MTFIAKLFPWFIVKRSFLQISHSNSFLVAGESLSAIRLNNAFYFIDLPASGFHKFLLFFNYLLPTALIIRHHSKFDFTVEGGSKAEPHACAVWQIDPVSALVEYFNPVELALKEAEWAKSRASLFPSKAERQAEQAAKKAVRQCEAEKQKARRLEDKARAVRAAAALRRP